MDFEHHSLIVGGVIPRLGFVPQQSMRHREQMLERDARILRCTQISILREEVDNRRLKRWKFSLTSRNTNQERGYAFRDRPHVVQIPRRKVNRPGDPPLVRSREIALDDEPATPSDEQGVKIALGPLLKKCLELGEAASVKTDLRRRRHRPLIVEVCRH